MSGTNSVRSSKKYEVNRMQPSLKMFIRFRIGIANGWADKVKLIAIRDEEM